MTNELFTLDLIPKAEAPCCISTIIYPLDNPLFTHSPCLAHHIKDNPIYQVCCPQRLSPVDKLSMLLLLAVDRSTAKFAVLSEVELLFISKLVLRQKLQWVE